MAAPTVRLAPTALRSERDPAVAAALRSVLSLASTLAARWDELDPASRRLTTADLTLAVDRVAAIAGNGDLVDPRDRVVGFDGVSQLTPREAEVLQALAAGASTASIARALGIGTSTVRSHVKSILVKLDAHSRVEAVAIASGGPQKVLFARPVG